MLDDVEHADRRDDRGFRIVVEPAQHQPLGGKRDRADEQRADDQRGEKAERRMAAAIAVDTNQATTAPSMKNSPCATLTTRMTPNTSDRPSAVSASTAAVTRPSSAASRRCGPKAI